MKKKISTHALFEIERIVAKEKDTGILSYTSLSKLMRDNEISCDVLAQAIDLAIAMPRKEVEEAITMYDTSSPKMDELKFVQDLADKYNVRRSDVIVRIQYVRRMKKAVERNGTDKKCYREEN